MKYYVIEKDGKFLDDHGNFNLLENADLLSERGLTAEGITKEGLNSGEKLVEVIMVPIAKEDLVYSKEFLQWVIDMMKVPNSHIRGQESIVEKLRAYNEFAKELLTIIEWKDVDNDVKLSIYTIICKIADGYKEAQTRFIEFLPTDSLGQKIKTDYDELIDACVATIRVLEGDLPLDEYKEAYKPSLRENIIVKMAVYLSGTLQQAFVRDTEFLPLPFFVADLFKLQFAMQAAYCELDASQLQMVSTVFDRYNNFKKWTESKEI